jgi:hypothetical protein
MAPAPAGRRMGACETPPPTIRPGDDLNRSPPRQLLLVHQHAPLLVGVQLVRPHPLRGLRALQLDPSSAAAPHTAHTRRTHTTTTTPAQNQPVQTHAPP